MANVDSLKSQLFECAKEWQRNLRRIGELLLELETEGENVTIVIREVLTEQFGMGRATAIVAMRWARGDYGTDDVAMRLLGTVAHSLLAEWTANTIAAVTNGRHRIYSPLERRIVTKPFADWSREEARANLDHQGVRPIAAETNTLPEFRTCIAQVFVSGPADSVIFIAHGREPIHMRVSRKLRHGLS